MVVLVGFARASGSTRGVAERITARITEHGAVAKRISSDSVSQAPMRASTCPLAVVRRTAAGGVKRPYQRHRPMGVIEVFPSDEQEGGRRWALLPGAHRPTIPSTRISRGGAAG